jgi:uncharacterized protein YndB with AHSA1/START domain
VPTYAATRTVLAPREDVWAFLAEPRHLADWWPGVVDVRPDRRGLAPGARWEVIGTGKPSLLRRPDAHGMLLVLAVDPLERIVLRLTGDRIDVELDLCAVESGRTELRVSVSGPLLIGLSRRLPHRAAQRLASLVQTAAV